MSFTPIKYCYQFYEIIQDMYNSNTNLYVVIHESNGQQKELAVFTTSRDLMNFISLNNKTYSKYYRNEQFGCISVESWIGGHPIHQMFYIYGIDEMLIEYFKIHGSLLENVEPKRTEFISNTLFDTDMKWNAAFIPVCGKIYTMDEICCVLLSQSPNHSISTTDFDNEYGTLSGPDYAYLKMENKLWIGL